MTEDRSNQTTKKYALLTGETISVFQKFGPDAPQGETWQADVIAKIGKFTIDHHAVGASAETAVTELQHYVERMRRQSNHENTGHAPVTTLAELDALDPKEVFEGYAGAERGDPEPGANHTRSYHHGWRTAMMDFGEIPRPPEHDRLVRGMMDRDRIARGEKPNWPNDMKVIT